MSHNGTALRMKITWNQIRQRIKELEFVPTPHAQDLFLSMLDGGTHLFDDYTLSARLRAEKIPSLEEKDLTNKLRDEKQQLANKLSNKKFESAINHGKLISKKEQQLIEWVNRQVF